jgi:hypothetical protein
VLYVEGECKYKEGEDLRGEVAGNVRHFSSLSLVEHVAVVGYFLKR